MMTWDEQNRATLWRVDRSDALAERMARGRTARTVVDDRRYREVGLLDTASGTLMVPDRYPTDSGTMGGEVFQLADGGPPEPLPTIDIDPFIRWLQEVLAAAASRGEFLVLEKGGWDFPSEPYALFLCARDGDGTWKSHVEAAPAPEGSQVWPPQRPRSNGATLTAPATASTVEAGALLLVDALSEWAPSPLPLGLTFGQAPDGPCLLDEGP